MQGIMELSQKDALGISFIVLLTLVSAPFLLSRYHARQPWAKIKNPDNFAGMLDKKSGIELLKMEAANRRFAIGSMIRQDDLRRQTVNIMVLWVLYSITELVFSVKNAMVFGTSINMDSMITALMGLLLAPLFYWFFTGLYAKITAGLNTVRHEFGVDGRLSMSDIASVEADKLNKLDIDIFSH